VKNQLNGEGVDAQAKQSRRKKAASLKNDASADCESAENRNYANASPKGNDASAASGTGRNYRKAPIRGYVSSRDARYHITEVTLTTMTLQSYCGSYPEPDPK
jgi:hypothetical protein